MMSLPASLLFSSAAGWKSLSHTVAVHWWKIRLIIGLLIFSQVPQASAGSFNINPVRIQLSSSVTTEVLRVTNSGNTDVTVQLQPMQWSQQDGEDQLKATRDLIATPQIFNMKAGASQIVRIGLAKKIDPSTEGAFRLILEEIPPPPEPGFQGLRLALRISLPVFVRPAVKADPSLEVRIAQPSPASAEQIHLELTNTGRTHVQLLNLKIHSTDPQEELLATLEKNIYLLAGQKKKINIQPKVPIPSTDDLLIRAETSTGKLELHAKSASP